MTVGVTVSVTLGVTVSVAVSVAVGVTVGLAVPAGGVRGGGRAAAELYPAAAEGHAADGLHHHRRAAGEHLVRLRCPVAEAQP